MNGTLDTRWETITPQMAERYLQNNNNRSLRHKKAAGFADDMRRGKWIETHQGIAFNCDGTLRDGQHRLSAIVLSGCPQRFLVTRGLGDDAVMVVDKHSPRTDADSLTLAGRPTTKDEVAVARQMWVGPRHNDTASKRPLTISTLADFLDEHSEAICFVSDGKRKRGVSHSASRAVVARAYYHCDHDRLRYFLQLVGTGIDENFDSRQDMAAIRLRDWLLEDSSSRQAGGSARAEVYCKTQSAVSAFTEYRALSKLYPRTADLFPLPEAT